LLQWLQKYLPRTPAVSDIAFNMVGHVAGWWAGTATAHLVRRAVSRHRALDTANRFALLMVGLWLVAELFPLVPTFDVSSLAENIKSLWQQPVWQPRRMLSHVGMTVIGLEALAQLVRSVSRALPVRGLAVAALCAVLAGKFVVIHQSPGMAVVLGIAGGGLLWAAVDWLRRWPGDRQPVDPLAALLCIAVANYLIYALWPLRLRRVPEPMSWLPFASSLSSSVEAVISSVAFECLCFGAIVWTAARRGYAWTWAAVCTALLAFMCEWTQRYLPTRTPEITSVLLALAMGWLVAALDRGRGEMLAAQPRA
jgi:VanZ family protein